MRVIHKQTLTEQTGSFDARGIIVPLSVQMQKGAVTFWYEESAEEDVPEFCYEYVIAPTGQPFSYDAGLFTPLGTVQTEIGLVWHVYIGKPQEKNND